MLKTIIIVVFLVLAALVLFGYAQLNQGNSISSNSSSTVATNQNNSTPPVLNKNSTNSTISNTTLQLNNSNASANASSTPPLLSDTLKVVSVVQDAVSGFISPTMQMGAVVDFIPLNVSFQNHQTVQTDFETPSSFKSYNPYDPNTGATNNLFFNNLYVKVFPSIPGGESQQSYVEIKNVNGFQVSYDIQNPNTVAESYDLSFACYSDPSLGAKYFVQASFNKLNYYNLTALAWDKLGFNDFVNTLTSACSTIK
jgi:hypothetical protein